MRRLLVFLIDLPLQIVGIPFAILGALWVGYRQLGVSRPFAAVTEMAENTNDELRRRST